LSGCDTEYAADLKYPLRTDPILGQSLSTIPPQFDRPGELSQIFAPILNDPKNEEKRNFLYPDKLKLEVQRQLDQALDQIFGTPHSPKANFPSEIRTAIAPLKQDDEILAHGSKLYRLHCLHCHGLTGNGRGPTAPWVNPHPRDYRQGMFKFIATQGGNERKPRREDLLRTLREGVEGTSMPTFALQPPADLEALVSYVINLSMRGEIEFILTKDFLKENQEMDFPTRLGEVQEDVTGPWVKAAAADSVVTPKTTITWPLPDDKRRESVRRGYRLFVHGKPIAGDEKNFKEEFAGACFGCHKDFGRQITYFYDDWGTIGRPADLTAGVYRGGRRPIDLYWRISGGILGVKMPASNETYSSEEIWDLVNFLQVLPYPRMRDKYDIKID
jgi:mono/diheme cytochrome c family protein